MPETVFSKILSGEFEASFVYRDELVSAFLDVNPVNPGHVLVIPNKPGQYLHDLDDETGARLFNVGRKIAEALRNSGIKCEGVNLFLADGVPAGQEVFHVHLHIIPRFTGDGFGLKRPAIDKEACTRPALNSLAEKIKKELEISV